MRNVIEYLTFETQKECVSVTNACDIRNITPISYMRIIKLSNNIMSKHEAIKSHPMTSLMDFLFFGILNPFIIMCVLFLQ